MFAAKLALSSALLASISVVFAASPEEPEEIQVEEGTDVHLKYVTPQNTNVFVLKWSRFHPEETEYLWFYSDKRLYYKYQNSSFKGRVTLADPLMKDGNVSLILSNTTVNDTGTYMMFITLSTGPGNQTTEHHMVNVTVFPKGHMSGGAKGGGDEDGGAKDGGAEDGGAEDGGDEDGGDEDGGAKDGGAKDGGAKDGGAEDGGAKDGGAKDGGAKDGGAEDGGGKGGGDEDRGGEDREGKDGGGEDREGKDGGGKGGGHSLFLRMVLSPVVFGMALLMVFLVIRYCGNIIG